MKKLVLVLQSMRPQQWIKNLLIFAALIFSQNLININLLEKSVYAFIIFCLLSGSLYLLNDVIDIKKDKEHPEKSTRPITIGKLDIKTALIVFLFLTVISLILSFFINLTFGLLTLSYFILNLFYTFSFKKIVIIDVMILASFYVLRAVAGAEAIQVQISSWLVICTLLLALFLAFGKRRHELTYLAGKAVNHRTILKEYSTQFIDQMISVVTASTVLVYILYTVSNDVVEKFGTKNLVYTTPFVLYGIFRYLYLIHKKEEGGAPSKVLLADRPLLINIFFWLICVIIIIYV